MFQIFFKKNWFFFSLNSDQPENHRNYGSIVTLTSTPAQTPTLTFKPFTLLNPSFFVAPVNPPLPPATVELTDKPCWPTHKPPHKRLLSESYLLFELHWMLNVHRVQETNTNTHTKNKNILLAASSAIVGTLMSFCYCSYRVQDAPQRTWPLIEQRKKNI